MMMSVKRGIAQLVLTLMVAGFAATVMAADAPVPVVNINKATEVELTYLPGIGPATASHIVEYRSRQEFKQPRHLMRVKGIGRKTFAKIEKYIVVQGPTTATKKIKSES